MPFIHVRSLPLEPTRDIAAVLEGLIRDFADGTGIGLEHVTATWDLLPAGHYAVGGRAAQRQPERSHPVLVDLTAPDFNPPELVETMLRTVAASIARRAGVPLDNVFVLHREARSGMVFDAGEIVRW